MTADLIAVIVCLAVSAFFSGSETALSSLPITRLEALRERSGRLTRAGLDRWAHDPQSLLITILVGNNMVNVLASALATGIAYRLSSNAGLAWVVGVMTLAILIFGEITPKTIAQTHAEAITLRVAPILYVLHVALRPVTATLGLVARALSPRAERRLPVTEEDLLFMLRLAHRHAGLPPDARLMMESVLRFQRAVAREVMVPRPIVETVDAGWELEQLRAVVAASPHSRFPVVQGSPDNLVGILHAKHLIRLTPADDWLRLAAQPVFIPEGKRLAALLGELQAAGQHMAVVLDEFGGFAGVVTLEDVLELLVGEIEDEFDLERSADVIAVGGGWSVSGFLSLRRLERLVRRPLPRPEEIESVGGLVASRLGTELRPGARVEWQGLELEVGQVSKGRPSRVLVRTARSH